VIDGLDHLQLAMPRGREDEARSFYGRVLGLEEIPKPEALAGRGGVWFALPGGQQLHLGVEEPFRAAAKAHPAFVSGNLDEAARVLAEAGFSVEWDNALAPRKRFYSTDAFGNRLEFLEKAS
jgi:catechol 2,3-dioxygenase-like lactoylglutathione lyase family enzyme